MMIKERFRRDKQSGLKLHHLTACPVLQRKWGSVNYDTVFWGRGEGKGKALIRELGMLPGGSRTLLPGLSAPRWVRIE